MRQLFLAISLIIALCYLWLDQEAQPVGSPQPSSTAATRIAKVPYEAKGMLQSQPEFFIPNLGQWDHPAGYVARFGQMTMFMQESGWTFTVMEPRKDSLDAEETPRPSTQTAEPSTRPGVAVRMTFEGASTKGIEPQQVLPGVHHYFLGSDPEQWRRDVPLYRALRYNEIQPGIDVLARQQDGQFEYDLILKAEAQLERIAIKVEGIERMRIDADGSLVLETRLGPVRMAAPPSWETGPAGEDRPISVSYVLLDDNRFGFEAPARQPGWSLIVDPGLVWSTYIGGTESDQIKALAIDAQGTTTVAGYTDSANFPSTPGAFQVSINNGSGYCDAYVTRLSPSGSKLIFSTFLGGRGTEGCTGLAIDTQGASIVTGSTYSPNFPTTQGAYDRSFTASGSARKVFVTKLSPTGSNLIYSTYLGGPHPNAPQHSTDLAIDGQGTATIIGWTEDPGFPTTPGVFSRSYSGFGDAFVSRLSANGRNLIYSTFVGGGLDDIPEALALDAQGRATVAGRTRSGSSRLHWPTTPKAYQGSQGNQGADFDGFVFRLSPSGSRLDYSTYLGGAGWDSIYDLALDSLGRATVTGGTTSINFPTTAGTFDTLYNGSSSGFLARLGPSGSSLVFSTFTPGHSTSIALNPAGEATIVGTARAGAPTTPGAFDTTFNSKDPSTPDLYLAKFSASGKSLLYATYLGGSGYELDLVLALDTLGKVTVAGRTNSMDFPTSTGAFDPTSNGAPHRNDVFIARLDMQPSPGLMLYGTSSPGCSDPLAISSQTLPQLGNAAFSLTCTNAPANASGGLIMGGKGLVQAILLSGADIWIDPTGPLLVVGTVSSNAEGFADYPMAIPANAALRGAQLFTQFIWAGPTAPSPCPKLGISTSNALRITVQ